MVNFTAGFTFPVDDPPFILVPVETNDNTLVDGKKVEVGTYIFLTKDTHFTPKMLALFMRKRVQAPRGALA